MMNPTLKSMRNKIYITGMVLFFSIILANCAEKKGKSDYTIYVSPDGNDNGSGAESGPIASLQIAAEMARERAGKVPVTIYLAGGRYFLSAPLNLGLKDGGIKKAPIHWKALPGEKPIINGGIPVNNWKKEENGSWSAVIPAEVENKFRSFYVNDKRATRARFPDNDYLKVDTAGKDNRTNFFFNKGDIPKLKDITDLELILLHDWSITRIGVKSIDWENNQLFAVDSIGARLPFFTITGWEKHPRYFLENASVFCNSPGEWYCDFKTNKIYYRPLPGENMNHIEAVIPIAPNLLTISGNRKESAKNIFFDGLTFAYTSWELPDNGYCGVQACMFTNRSNKSLKVWDKVPAALELDFVNNIKFNNCTIKHTGGSGIWIRENSLNCEISNSHIYDISGNGINIGEGQDRLVDGLPWWQSAPKDVSRNIKITHSLIEDCGKQFYGAVGIWGGLVANTVIENNEIRNLPYTGLSIGWVWDTTATPCKANIINANHIHHVMNRLSDGGGIYTLGQQPGSRISNNLVHDVTVNQGRAESNGMFLDEGTRDVVIENNIVYNIARSPLRFHKAVSNIVRKNVLVCGSNTPPIRYNNTKEADIVKDENLLLSHTSQTDVKKLNKLVKERISDLKLGRQ